MRESKLIKLKLIRPKLIEIKKVVLALLVLTLVTLIASETSFAQFKKYGSKTSFNRPDIAPAVPANSAAAAAASDFAMPSMPSAASEGAKYKYKVDKLPTDDDDAPVGAGGAKAGLDDFTGAGGPGTGGNGTDIGAAADFDSEDDDGGRDILGRGTGIVGSGSGGSGIGSGGFGTGRTGSGGRIGAADKNNKDKDKYVNLNPETAFGPEVLPNFDFPDIDLLQLTKYMQKLTGINLIYEKDIKGKISISAPTPLTIGDAWKAYLTALNIHNYTLVKSGAFYKIVQIRNIRNSPPKIYMGNYTPNTENFVIRIMTLKNVTTSEIIRNFRQFTSQFGAITEIRQTNTIILKDTGSIVNRLVKMIKFLDVPGYEETLQIIKVKNSSAPEIAALLEKIIRGGQGSARFQGGDMGGGMRPQAYVVSKLIAEPRTNSIIAMATAEGARQLRELIKKLDVGGVSKGSGQIHVRYLHYGDAETLAKTLNSLVSSAGTPGAAINRFGPRPPGEAAPLFSSAVKITADKANNALVVMASPTDYLTIKKIIGKLDIARDQVYVEGLVMEASVTSGTQFGVTLAGAYGRGNAERYSTGADPASSQQLMNLITGNITNLSGIFYGLGMGREVEIPAGNGTAKYKVNSVNGLITALAKDSNTNVLATPQILALDNEEAIFESGETVPVQTREVATGGVSTTSVKDKSISLIL
ncbi:MAG: hypothetical protein HQK53_10190, partial [Oligoflexia bacterium]|nr:hypothetical protein [Oligoflexia bacterium]